MPEAAAFGEDLHPTLHEKAAAHLFHLTKNHPFVDGNKRVGLAVCFTFLALNGVWVKATEDELVALVLGAVSGERSKADLAVFLRAASCPTSPGG
jgi:death-on-curing protein